MFENINDFCNSEISREDLKEMILAAALDLACCCKENFDGDTVKTARVALALYYFNMMLDEVK